VGDERTNSAQVQGKKALKSTLPSTMKSKLHRFNHHAAAEGGSYRGEKASVVALAPLLRWRDRLGGRSSARMLAAYQ
jgi:hypothetical protein